MRSFASPWGVVMSHHSGSVVRRVDLTLTIAQRGQLAASARKAKTAPGSRSMRTVLVTDRAVIAVSPRTLAVGLETIAVRIDDEAGVVVGAVVGPHAGLAV